MPHIFNTASTSDQDPPLGDARHLLSSHRWTEVQRGIQFAATRNERGILTQLADALSIEDQGYIVVAPHAEVRRTVRREFQSLAAFYILRASNGLAGLTSLRLSWCPSLTDVSALAALSGLDTLNLRGCASVTDVSSLGGLAARTAIELDGSGVRQVSVSESSAVGNKISPGELDAD